MARFNEILVGRYNRLVQKLLSMKGPATLVTISDEMMPVLPFVSGVENRYLESWETFGVVGNQAAVAANTSGVRLRNPGGSNVIAVIEKLVYVNNSAVVDVPFLLHGAIAADLASIPVITGSRLDSRGRAQPTCILSLASPAATFGVTLYQITNPINTVYDFIAYENQEIPLLPGDAIQMQSNLVNQPLFINVRWRERFLEDSERA